MAKPIIGLMLGDATGIGPEISARLLASGVAGEVANVVVIGDRRVLELGMRDAGVKPGYRVHPSVDSIRWPAEQLPVLDLGNIESASTIMRQTGRNDAAQIGSQSGGRHAAGHLAGIVAAHAVGQDGHPEVGIGEDGIFVVRTDGARIGAHRHFEEAGEAHWNGNSVPRPCSSASWTTRSATARSWMAMPCDSNSVICSADARPG